MAQTEKEHAAWMRAFRERMFRSAVINMTKHMVRRLVRYQARLHKRGQALDKPAWHQFLSKLLPEEKSFLRRFFEEAHDPLVRAAKGEPLAKAIRANAGRLPMPRGWRRRCTSAFPG